MASLDFAHSVLLLLIAYFAGYSIYVWIVPGRFIDRYADRWRDRLEPLFGSVTDQHIVWHVRIIHLVALSLVVAAFIAF